MLRLTAYVPTVGESFEYFTESESSSLICILFSVGASSKRARIAPAVVLSEVVRPHPVKH